MSDAETMTDSVRELPPEVSQLPDYALQLKQWRQDLNLLWMRWDVLPGDERDWLVQDFVRRAENQPEKLEGLSELVVEDLERLESFDWLSGDNDEAPADEIEADLPTLESLHLPESNLRSRRSGLKQFYTLCQARIDALWLNGVNV